MAQAMTNIPARPGRAALVRKKALVKAINTHDTQVVDCWAFNPVNQRPRNAHFQILE